MSFCPNCGTPSTPGVTSCSRCGAPIAASPAAPPAGQQFVDMPSPASGGYNPNQYGNVPLPAVSPLAIILAAGAWVVGGPLLSLPGVFVARSDIRGIREGRYHPDGLSQSQLAFWIAAVNVGVFCLACFAIVGVLFLAGGIGALSASKHSTKTSPGVVSTEFSGKADSALTNEIEDRIAKKGPAEQALWKDISAEWATMRRMKASAPNPDAGRMNSLLDKVKSDPKLWAALVEGERRAWQATNRPAPARAPAEAPEGTGKDQDW